MSWNNEDNDSLVNVEYCVPLATMPTPVQQRAHGGGDTHERFPELDLCSTVLHGPIHTQHIISTTLLALRFMRLTRALEEPVSFDGTL